MAAEHHHVGLFGGEVLPLPVGQRVGDLGQRLERPLGAAEAPQEVVRPAERHGDALLRVGGELRHLPEDLVGVLERPGVEQRVAEQHAGLDAGLAVEHLARQPGRADDVVGRGGEAGADEQLVEVGGQARVEPPQRALQPLGLRQVVGALDPGHVVAQHHAGPQRRYREADGLAVQRVAEGREQATGALGHAQHAALLEVGEQRERHEVLELLQLDRLAQCQHVEHGSGLDDHRVEAGLDQLAQPGGTRQLALEAPQPLVEAQRAGVDRAAGELAQEERVAGAAVAQGVERDGVDRATEREVQQRVDVVGAERLHVDGQAAVAEQRPHERRRGRSRRRGPWRAPRRPTRRAARRRTPRWRCRAGARRR